MDSGAVLLINVFVVGLFICVIFLVILLTGWLLGTLNKAREKRTAYKVIELEKLRS